MQAIGIDLPKLPELDAEDVKAVRSFLPGKLLSRTAAVLALVVLVLAVAGSVDKGLRLLEVDLSPIPSLRYGLLFGLPLIAVASQLVLEWRAERGRRELQRLAVQPGVEQSGYFRIGPYLNTAEDRAKFDRADRVHEKVLSWIERSSSFPLYLTGDSGSGKSSLLNASVLPALRDHGWTVVEARAWQDPEAALRNALTDLRGVRRPRHPESQNLLHLRASAVRPASTRLLLVLDQFEEFLILGKPEQQQRFATLVSDLRVAPIQGLKLLLVLRSDYQMHLDDLGLPEAHPGATFRCSRSANRWQGRCLWSGIGLCASIRRLSSSKFATDSALQGTGFEPSLPLTGYSGVFRERPSSGKFRTCTRGPCLAGICFLAELLHAGCNEGPDEPDDTRQCR